MPARYRDLRERALEFVEVAKADLGVSDAYATLQQLYLQVEKEGPPRAIFLLTGADELVYLLSLIREHILDGFLIDETRCLGLASQNSARTRLFVFGTGTCPNRGFLLSLARAGCGEAEIINAQVDPKEAARRQLARAIQPGALKHLVIITIIISKFPSPDLLQRFTRSLSVGIFQTQRLLQ